MHDPINDLRIRSITPLSPPVQVLAELPPHPAASATVRQARADAHAILHGADDRLIVVIGPCSIHDPAAALDYAGRLARARERHRDTLHVVMRAYFEKPRTTVGWKGLINDPSLDGSHRIEDGLRLARRLLLDVNGMGLPTGCEFLDTITPQYLADLASWGAIGARTTESQMHRELASGLSCPIGFKNGTGGDLKVAVDAICAASQPHRFLAVTADGRAAIAATAGNEDCHIILRGGTRPNYQAGSVAQAAVLMLRARLQARIMVDVSHANSGKDPGRQPEIVADVARQVADGDHRIIGLMVESHIVAGRQDREAGRPLAYGQSITDGCIDWGTTERVLDTVASAVRKRRTP